MDGPLIPPGLLFEAMFPRSSCEMPDVSCHALLSTEIDYMTKLPS